MSGSFWKKQRKLKAGCELAPTVRGTCTQSAKPTEASTFTRHYPSVKYYRDTPGVVTGTVLRKQLSKVLVLFCKIGDSLLQQDGQKTKHTHTHTHTHTLVRDCQNISQSFSTQNRAGLHRIKIQQNLAIQNSILLAVYIIKNLSKHTSIHKFN